MMSRTGRATLSKTTKHERIEFVSRCNVSELLLSHLYCFDVVQMEDDDPLLCSQGCGKKYTTVSNRNKHERRCRGPKTCEHCSFWIVYGCNIIGYVFEACALLRRTAKNVTNYIRRHLKEHHEEVFREQQLKQRQKSRQNRSDARKRHVKDDDQKRKKKARNKMTGEEKNKSKFDAIVCPLNIATTCAHLTNDA